MVDVREYRIGNRVYKIYSREIADKIGIEYKENWREGREGDYILCDDGYVAPVIKEGVIKSKTGGYTSRWIRIPTGTFAVHSKKGITTEERASRYTFNGKTFAEAVMDRDYFTPGEIKFCKYYVMFGGDRIKAYMKAYRTKSKVTADNHSKILLRTERVREMIKQEVREVLEKCGVTYEYLVEKLKNIAEEGEKESAKLKALEMLCDIAGINEKVKTQGELEFKGFSRKALEGYESEVKGRLKAKVEDG